MPYRQGQMAAGDYYRSSARGDLFGFIGKAIKGIAGVAGSVLPGPLGIVGRAVSGAFGGATRQNPIGATLTPPVIFGGGTLGSRLPVLRPDSTVTRSGVGLGPLQIGTTTTTYGHTIAGKKRRRMNVTNVKALRRAGRRVTGFEKLARRFVGFASPHKPKGRTYFKRSRKRS